MEEPIIEWQRIGKNKTPINGRRGKLRLGLSLCITIVVYSDKKNYLHNERPELGQKGNP